MSPLRAGVELRLGAFALKAAVDVNDGEVLAVLGPNGAGKSTLLRCLAGLVPLERGRVHLGDRLLEEPARGWRLPPEDRGIGLVFQDYLLFPHLSARDNVAFGLRARRFPAAEAQARADHWLARIGLADQRETRPHALSGGQAQRVALARALATEPDLLLLDEPLSALDVDARHTVRSALKAQLRDFAGPCLLVTHDPLEAMMLADRLVVLEAGRVTQAGTADDVTRRPRSAWVGRLVGLNLYRGRAAGAQVQVAGGALVTARPINGPAFAVIHPRAVALYRSRPDGSPRNVWHAPIDGIDVHGDRVRVHVGGAIPITAEVTPGAIAELDLAIGELVWVAIKASEVETYPA